MAQKKTNYDLLIDLITRLTAVRAGYLDQLDFALQEAIAALQTDLDNPAQYMANLTTLETRLSAVRAGYLDELDFDLQGALSTIAAYIDTEIGAIETKLDTPANFMADLTTLEARLSAARALLLDEITALRMAELDAANIPADIDTLLTRVTAAVATAAALTAHEASQATHRAVLVDIHDTDLPAVKTDTGNIKTQTEYTEDSASGTTANAYADALDIDTRGMKSMSMELANTDGANSLTWQLRCRYADYAAGTDEEIVEAPGEEELTFGTKGLATLLKAYSRIKVQVKSTVGGSHATYTLTYLINR